MGKADKETVLSEPAEKLEEREGEGLDESVPVTFDRDICPPPGIAGRGPVGGGLVGCP